MSQQQTYKIVNPLPDGPTHIGRAHFDRLKRQGLAEFDTAGRVVRKYRSREAARKAKHDARLRVDRFSGCDAFPDRAVLPPSPEYLARIAHRPGRPVTPPLLYTGANQQSSVSE